MSMSACVIGGRLLLALVGGPGQPYLAHMHDDPGKSPVRDETALLATRSEFPTLTKGVHLISHSLGAMPRQARAYATQFLDEWESESINSWHEWLPAVRTLADLV